VSKRWHNLFYILSSAIFSFGYATTANHYTLLYIIIHRMFIRLIPELRC